MMCKAKELALELESVVLRIQDEFKESTKELQRLDLMKEDVLHHMENNNFNANQGYKYAKALQVISKERRIVKNEYVVLHSLNQRIESLNDKILKVASNTLKQHKKVKHIYSKGHDAYTPRIIKSLDKNDVLNQVIEILNDNKQEGQKDR
ncbi:MAG: hypothetical protein ACRCX2_29145 [Paraclostridium sp.]